MTVYHESQRKDVERFFGVFHGRLKILSQEFYGWSDEYLMGIVKMVIFTKLKLFLRSGGELDKEIDELGGTSPISGRIRFLLGSSERRKGTRRGWNHKCSLSGLLKFLDASLTIRRVKYTRSSGSL